MFNLSIDVNFIFAVGDYMSMLAMTVIKNVRYFLLLKVKSKRYGTIILYINSYRICNFSGDIWI